jgi:Ca-activated chloride channel family protein
MTFLAPGRLWLLLLVAGIVVAYVVMQSRRRHYAARFTNLDLLSSVAPKRPGWRRHVAAIAVLCGLVALVFGLARPARDEKVPTEHAIVMMVIDVSASMRATDVSPSRIAAAQSAAANFVEQVPAKFQVGLIAFDGSTRVLATPTTDHASVIDSIRTLKTGPGTATGDALSTAVDTVNTTLKQAKAKTTTKKGEAPPATIVLVSDGVSTVGSPVSDATTQAKHDGIPVTTIAYGTPNGQVTVEGEIVDVPADPQAMNEVANATGGKFFTAQSANELKNVYNDIQARVGFHLEQREIVRFFIALALVALLLAIVASLVWGARFL